MDNDRIPTHVLLEGNKIYAKKVTYITVLCVIKTLVGVRNLENKLTFA